VLSAASGMGKSTAVGYLCQKHNKNILGFHLIQVGDTTKTIGQSLAYQIAYHLPPYRLRILSSAMKLDTLRSYSMQNLWEELLLLPLQDYTPQRDQPYLFICDGLDRLSTDQQVEIQQLFKCLCSICIPIRVLLTTRDPSTIENQLMSNISQGIFIDCNDPRNMRDIRIVLEAILNFSFTTVSDKLSIVSHIIDQSEGRFEYIRLFRNFISNLNRTTVYSYSTFLQHFNAAGGFMEVQWQGFYDSYVESIFRYQSNLFNCDGNRLLQLFAVSRAPIPLQLIADLLKLSRNAVTSLISDLQGLLLISRENTISVYHSSLHNYLSSSKFLMAFDPKEIHLLFVDAFTVFTDISSTLGSSMEPPIYFLEHYYYHCLMSGKRREELFSLAYLWQLLQHGKVRIIAENINLLLSQPKESPESAEKLFLESMISICSIWEVVMKSLRSNDQLTLRHFFLDFYGRLSALTIENSFYKSMLSYSQLLSAWDSCECSSFLPVQISYQNHVTSHLYSPFRFTALIDCMTWTPQQDLLVSSQGRISCYSGGDYQLLFQVQLQDNPIYSIACIQDGRIVCGGEDGYIRIADVDGAIRSSFHAHDEPINSIALLFNNRIVSGSEDRKVCIWDPNLGCLSNSLNFDEAITALLVVFTEDLACILIGLEDGTLYQWSADIDTDEIRYPDGHIDEIVSLVKISATRFASGSNDKTVRIWDILNRSCLHELSLESAVTSLVYNMKEDVLFCACNDSSIKLHSFNPNIPSTCSILGQSLYVQMMLLTNDGNSILTSMTDYSILIQRLPLPEFPPKAIERIIYFHRLQTIITVSDSLIQHFDMTTRNMTELSSNHSGISHVLKYNEESFVIIGLDVITRKSYVAMFRCDTSMKFWKTQRIDYDTYQVTWIQQAILLDADGTIVCYDSLNRVFQTLQYDCDSMIFKIDVISSSKANTDEELITCICPISKDSFASGSNLGHVIIWTIELESSRGSTWIASRTLDLKGEIRCLSAVDKRMLLAGITPVDAVLEGRITMIDDLRGSCNLSSLCSTTFIPKQLFWEVNAGSVLVISHDGCYYRIPASKQSSHVRICQSSMGQWLVCDAKGESVTASRRITIAEDIMNLYTILTELGHQITCSKFEEECLVFGTSSGILFVFKLSDLS
jgi:WD40 repeat protein